MIPTFHPELPQCAACVTPKVCNREGRCVQYGRSVAEVNANAAALSEGDPADGTAGNAAVNARSPEGRIRILDEDGSGLTD